MKKIAASLVLASAVTGFSASASASESSGLYFVVQGGALSYPSSNLDNYYSALGGGTFTPTTDNGVWGADVGKPVRGIVGLQLGPHYAIEGSAMYFPTVKYNGNDGVNFLTSSSKALASSATLVYIASGDQPGDYVSLLVKVGMAYLRGSSTVNGTGAFNGVPNLPSAFGDGTKVSPTYGIAVSSDMNDYLSLRFDWDSYSTPDTGAGRFNTYMFGVGLKF
jgi:hypothetical protein